MANDHKRAGEFGRGDPILVLGHGAHGRPRRARIERLEGNTARVLYEDTQLTHRVRLANIVLDQERLKSSRRLQEPLTATIGDQIARKTRTLPETEALTASGETFRVPAPIPVAPDPTAALHAAWGRQRLSEWIDVFHAERAQSWASVGAQLGLSIGRLVELRKARTLAEDDELVTIALCLDKLMPGFDWLTDLVAMRERDREAGVRERLIKVKPGRKHGLEHSAPVIAPTTPISPPMPPTTMVADRHMREPSRAAVAPLAPVPPTTSAVPVPVASTPAIPTGNSEDALATWLKDQFDTLHDGMKADYIMLGHLSVAGSVNELQRWAAAPYSQSRAAECSLKICRLSTDYAHARARHTDFAVQVWWPDKTLTHVLFSVDGEHRRDLLAHEKATAAPALSLVPTPKPVAPVPAASASATEPDPLVAWLMEQFGKVLDGARPERVVGGRVNGFGNIQVISRLPAAPYDEAHAAECVRKIRAVAFKDAKRLAARTDFSLQVFWPDKTLNWVLFSVDRTRRHELLTYVHPAQAPSAEKPAPAGKAAPDPVGLLQSRQPPVATPPPPLPASIDLTLNDDRDELATWITEQLTVKIASTPAAHVLVGRCATPGMFDELARYSAKPYNASHAHECSAKIRCVVLEQAHLARRITDFVVIVGWPDGTRAHVLFAIDGTRRYELLIAELLHPVSAVSTPKATAPKPLSEPPPKSSPTEITVIANGISLSGSPEDIRRLLRLEGA